MNFLKQNRSLPPISATQWGVGALLLLLATSSGWAQESVKIEPYTGPPIYLEEPEAPPAATVVERREITEKYADGTVRLEREVARFSDNHYEGAGYYREYYPDGKKFVEGQYQKGRQQGEWTYWYQNGQSNRVVQYEEGQPHGSWDVYHKDGALLAKRRFNQGKRHGTWVTYDDTGKQPLQQENYDQGKADGEWKIWFPSGQLRRQINFLQGKRHGPFLEWDKEGNPRGELNYVEGKLHGKATHWAADGKKVEQQFDQGKLVTKPNE